MPGNWDVLSIDTITARIPAQPADVVGGNIDDAQKDVEGSVPAWRTIPTQLAIEACRLSRGSNCFIHLSFVVAVLLRPVRAEVEERCAHLNNCCSSELFDDDLTSC